MIKFGCASFLKTKQQQQKETLDDHMILSYCILECFQLKQEV